MEITGHSNGLPVVRQKPGGNNSLGLVKFLFPNNYNIYFHDTPNRDLFDISSRGLSHGCIRLGEPTKFARYLLRNDTTAYPAHKIDSLMHGTKEYWVTLRKPLPVFIGYFTAWVDRQGQINFRKDIYNHDAEMAAKLFEK
jgi:murein L,D-transpeptidase YcbB/YkuD